MATSFGQNLYSTKQYTALIAYGTLVNQSIVWGRPHNISINGPISSIVMAAMLPWAMENTRAEAVAEHSLHE